MRAMMTSAAVAAALAGASTPALAQNATIDPTVLRLIESMQAQQAAMMQILARTIAAPSSTPPNESAPPAAGAPRVVAARSAAQDAEIEALRRRVHELEAALARAMAPVVAAEPVPKIELARTPGRPTPRVQVAALPAATDATDAPPKPQQWSVSAEALAWRPHTTDNVIGFLGRSNITSTTTSTPNSFTSVSSFITGGGGVRLEYDRTPGFRGSIGYTPPGTNLDVTAGGTFLRASGSDSKAGMAQCIGCSATYGSTEAELHFRYDVADIAAGYTFRPTEGLTLRPFGGARYAHLEQNFEVMQRNLQGQNILGGSGVTQTRSELDALGGRLGLDAAFFLGAGFSLTGRAGGSLLYGWHDTRQQTAQSSSTMSTSGNFTSSSTSTSLFSSSSRETLVVPAVDFDIGVSWLHRLGDLASVEIAAGYHFEHWFNQASSGTGVAPSVLSDLSLEGPYFRVTGRF